VRFGVSRRFLAVGALCALVAVLWVGGRLGGLMRSSLGEVLIGRLQAEAAWLRHGVRGMGGAGGLPDTQVVAAWVAAQPHDADTVYALRSADGRVLAPGPVPWPQGPTEPGGEPRLVPQPEGSLWRAVAVDVPTRDGTLEAVIFGRAIHTDEALQRLYGLLGLLLVIGLGLAGAALGHTTRVLGRALTVMEDSARNIAALRGGSRVPRLGSASELGGLPASLNALAESFEHTVATLGAERDRFEAVLEGLSDAVIALDAQQRITLVNRSAMYLFELEHPPLGRPLIEVTRLPMLHEVLERVPRERSVKVEVDWPGRRRRRLLLQGGTLRASEGIVLVLQDLTALRRLETVRRDFVANVSHELRTPVGVILASAETLLDGALDDPPAARGFVEALHRNAERLARLVGDLLDLSRIEAGQFQMKPIELDLHDAVEHVIDQLGSKAERKGIQLVNEIRPGTRVLADLKALDQVLVNLTDNAIKYSPDGSRVRSLVSLEPGRARVQIEDNGPGIEPAHRERVFERFYRVDPGRSREMGGTGLGLSIVKHLIEHMGGEVGVESVTPHGARFHFTLPLPAQGAQTSRVSVQ
jgi:two-component system phosphate regulon sensor histidine kinase PhoR